MPTTLDLVLMSGGAGIFGFAIGMWWTKAIEKANRDNKPMAMQHRMELIQQRKKEMKERKRTRTLSRMTPRLLQTLTHDAALKYLQTAGVPEDLLQAIPPHVDGFILMECATPDKFDFSTADKLFWVQIENKEACKRISIVLDDLIEQFPDDLDPSSDQDSEAATPVEKHPKAGIALVAGSDASAEDGDSSDASTIAATDNNHQHAYIDTSDLPFRETANHTGVMHTSPTQLMGDWIQRGAEHLDFPMMEVGCAYGIATMNALAQGATVLAIDLDRSHLEYLAQQANDRGVPAQQLWCVHGAIPEVLREMDDASVSHVLAANVLHFLSPSELEEALSHLHRMMTPNSYLYVQLDSPFIRGLGMLYYFYIFKKALGMLYPGYFWLPRFLAKWALPDRLSSIPCFHVMDVDTITHAARKAGFNVVDAGYHPLKGDTDALNLKLDGRESCVLVARK